MARKITIFYSYSLVDEDYQKRLAQHLTRLRQRGFITERHKTAPGDSESESVRAQLQQANIILLLVSPDSMGSEDPLYQKELAQALEQQQKGDSRIVPILIRPYSIENTAYGDLKYLPEGGPAVSLWWPNEDAAFDSIAQSLEKLIEEELAKNDEFIDDFPVVDQSMPATFPVTEQSIPARFPMTDQPIPARIPVTDRLTRANFSRPQAISAKSKGEISTQQLFNLPCLTVLVLMGVGIFLIFSNILHFSWLLFFVFSFYALCILAVQSWQKYTHILFEKAGIVFAQGKCLLLSRHYRRLYLEQIIQEHQFSDVKGLSRRSAHSMELEQIYIDLSVNYVAPHRATTNPFSLATFSVEQGASFLHYLSSLRSPQIRWVIIGTPGSGKATLLKLLTLALARRRKKPFPFRRELPVFLYIRDLVNAVKDDSDFTLAHAIHRHMQKRSEGVLPLLWFSRQLKRRRCFVLLDGLDDISDPAMRRQVIGWVQNQAGTFRKSHFMLTSRPYAYGDYLEGFSVMAVYPLNKMQIKDFVQRWYLANELKSIGGNGLDIKRSAQDSATDLLLQIEHTPGLPALAVNPLLLTMIANIHSSGESLPDKRIALYTEICEVFLGKRQEEFGLVEDFSFLEKQQVLQPLAYHMMCSGKREMALKEVEDVILAPLASIKPGFSANTFIKIIEDGSGLLLELNPGFYGFAQPTFQEFFAAMHIKEKDLEEELATHITDDWWRETIRLYCALTNASNFIEMCISEDNLSAKTLELVLGCQKEALFIQQSTHDQIANLLTQSIESADLEMRRVGAEARLTQRLRTMVPLQRSLYIDSRLVSCVEYQLFLDEQLKQGRFLQPDHWIEPSFSAGTGNLPILGVRLTDANAFCQWLTLRETGPWQYRLPTAKEARNLLEGEHKVDWKEEKTGFWVQEKHVILPHQPPLSQEEVMDLIPEQYMEAFQRVFDRLLDIDRVSAVSRESESMLAYSQKQVTALPIMYQYLSDYSTQYKNVLDSLHGLEQALHKSLDRSLLVSSSIQEPAWEELYSTKSASFFKVRRILQPLIDYYEEISSATSHILQGARRGLGSKKITDSAELFRQTIERYQDMHVTFLLLEKRLNESPAWEGILLVKERKSESQK